jgi:hypothetical protein
MVGKSAMGAEVERMLSIEQASCGILQEILPEELPKVRNTV